MPEYTDKLLDDLEAAVSRFDEREAARICTDLREQLALGVSAFDVRTAERALEKLRKKRFFGLLEATAAAFLAANISSPKIRQRYAQALLDQSKLAAAIAVLTELAEETLDEPAENAEAHGLLGRAFKQVCVDARDERWAAQAALRRSIAEYWRIYDSDRREYIWQGINVVALLARARRHQIDSRVHIDPGAIARDICEVARDRDGSRKADMWTFGTALEASVALGDLDAAVAWGKRYVDSDYCDAFELGSTIRQLTEVWELDADRGVGQSLLPLLRGELLKRSGGGIRIELPRQTALAEPPTPGEGLVLERNWGRDAFTSIEFFRLAIQRAKAVARIESEVGKPEGTGFLVDANELCDAWQRGPLLVTNAHVVSALADDHPALRPDEARVAFTLGPAPLASSRVAELVWSSPRAELDVSLLRLSEPPAIEACRVTSYLPEPDDERTECRFYIIGHPAGDKLQVSLYDNLLQMYAPDPAGGGNGFAHYRTPTEPGSSGSPVFDHQWRAIGVHHGACADSQTNRGTLFNAVRRRLQARFGGS